MKLRDAINVGGVLFTGGLILPSACAREKPPVVTPAPAIDRPDVVRDLAAVLPNQGGVLCVHPTETEQVLERLGAKLTGVGVYAAELSNAAGERRPATFEVLRTDKPYLCSNAYRKQRKTPSPIVDLVAFMPKAGDRLCVRPEHVAPVLERLGAKPMEGDRYVVLDRRAGEPVERIFRLEPRPAPILCAFGGDDEDDPKPPVNGGGRGGNGGSAGTGMGTGAVSYAGRGAGGTAGAPGNERGGTEGEPGYRRCETSEPPELCEGEGVWPLGLAARERFRDGIYVIYEHADCNESFGQSEGKCLPAGDGRFRRESMQAYRACGRGNGYCVSAFTIVGVRRFYDNDACGGQPVEEEPQKAGACYEGAVGGGWLADDPIFEDSFTLYRNATCDPITRAFDRECQDSRTPRLGRYEQEHYDLRHLCKKGGGYCAETWSKIGTRTYYDLRNGTECGAATNRESIVGALCLP